MRVLTINAALTISMTQRRSRTLMKLTAGTPLRSRGYSFRAAVLMLVALIPRLSSIQAEDFQCEFESPEVSWKVLLQPQDSKLMRHERRRGVGKSGGAEVVRFQSAQENSPFRLEHLVPPATVL